MIKEITISLEELKKLNAENILNNAVEKIPSIRGFGAKRENSEIETFFDTKHYDPSLNIMSKTLSNDFPFDKDYPTTATKTVKKPLAICPVCQGGIHADTKYRSSSVSSKTGSRIYICMDCYKKGLAHDCVSCGYTFDTKSLFHSYCPKCLDSAPARIIKNYSFKAEKSIPRIGQPFDQTFFGVELELECVNNYGKHTILTSQLTEKYAVLKKDSSIINGFEIVSAPVDITNHKTLWVPFFEYAQTPDIVASERCGMHVHVSKFYDVDMTPLQVGKILSFIHNPLNRQYIEAIAGRESGYHNNFTKKKKISDGKMLGQQQQDMDRHTAVNCGNSATLEFRIFAATKDINIFLKNIEFCRAIVKFTAIGEASIRQCESFECFYNFLLTNHRDEYRNLVDFINLNKVFDFPKQVRSKKILDQLKAVENIKPKRKTAAKKLKK